MTRLPTQLRRAAVAFASTLAFACSSSDAPSTSTAATSSTTSSTGAGSTTTGAGGTGGGSDALVGGFAVSLIAADATTQTPAFTNVAGKVYNGPVPSAVIWTAVDQAGGCTLKTPKVPFCSPACTGGSVCVSDGQCAAYPAGQDLGMVRVTGVGPTEFEMEGIQNAYAPAAGVQLPYPPSAEGADIIVATSGGAYAPFTLQAKGIAPLELSGADPLPLKSGEPLKLEWTKPGNADVAHIIVELDISHHGGQKGEIDCDAPDNGSLEIPAALITKLVGLGVAGFPSVSVRRESSATTQIEPGRVVLLVSSGVDRSLQIPGIVSCNMNSDCAMGTCQADRTCR